MKLLALAAALFMAGSATAQVAEPTLDEGIAGTYQYQDGFEAITITEDRFVSFNFTLNLFGAARTINFPNRLRRTSDTTFYTEGYFNVRGCTGTLRLNLEKFETDEGGVLLVDMRRPTALLEFIGCSWHRHVTNSFEFNEVMTDDDDDFRTLVESNLID